MYELLLIAQFHLNTPTIELSAKETKCTTFCPKPGQGAPKGTRGGKRG